MLFTSIKDICSNALSPFYLILLFFLTRGRMTRLRWAMEKLLFGVLCPSGLQFIQQRKKEKKDKKKKNRGQQGLWVLFICVLARLISPEDFFFVKREGEGVIVFECYQSWGRPSEPQVAVHSTSSCWEEEEGVFWEKCTEMSEVRQCKHRHAGIAQTSRTQIFHKHMEVAVELGSWFQVQFLKCYLTTQGRVIEKEWFNLKL